MTEYKIGGIKPDDWIVFAKYIFADVGGDVCYFSDRFSKYHRDIAKSFGLSEDSILGGGCVSVDDTELIFDGGSTIYGAVPREILERLLDKLLAEYKRIEPVLETVKIDIDQDNPPRNRTWEKYLEKTDD